MERIKFQEEQTQNFAVQRCKKTSMSNVHKKGEIHYVSVYKQASAWLLNQVSK
jgi:hypothetical protein